jgi:Concanavalin A-like lectin/glucanases superfamily
VGNNTTNSPVSGLAAGQFDVLSLKPGNQVILQGATAFIPSNNTDKTAELITFWNANNVGVRTAVDEVGGGSIISGTCLVPSNAASSIVATPVELSDWVTSSHPVTDSATPSQPSDGVTQSHPVTTSTPSVSTASSNGSNGGNTPEGILSGETVTVNGSGSGFTLPANKSTTIKFRATINTGIAAGTCAVSTQGTVSGSNFSSVLTDDPSVGGGSNPTSTTIVAAPSITTCQTNLSPNIAATACTSSQSFAAVVAGCPTPTLTYKIGTTTITSPYNFPVGTSTVDVTASNGVGSNATCSFTVNVTRSAASPTTTNNALNFDGTNDYVDISNCSGAALDVLNAITIEYWFKGTNLQSAVRLQNVAGYIVAGWSTGLHIISSDGGTTGGLSVGANAMNGNWHHVAMTWQRNTVDGFKSYLDGQLVARRNSLDVALPSINSGMYLGAYNGSSEFMNGTLDEVRVWNVARTQAQIQAGINGCTFTSQQANLVIYYKFDHGSGGGSNSGINTMVNSANATTYPAALNNFALAGSSSNWTAVSCAVLPIELTSINITAQSTANLLTWTTASEVNVAYFAIERSIDGLSFDKIGETKAQGKGSTYEFTDDLQRRDAMHRISTTTPIAYYRIRSIDNNGTENLSKIVSITRKATGSLKVYPSIARDYLNVETDLTDDFIIVNALGQVLMHGKMVNSLDISALSVGLYVFRIGQAQAKFVKQ